MNHENPTPLRVGMTGSFVGRRYRVDGRVVLSMDLDGQTWYWNEFNLVTTGGEAATLVHEEGENGPEWRLFTPIEPEVPITVEQAARVAVGDTVHFGGQPARVTLVDESRVEFIEGQAPEGVEVGDVARYFNAESDSELVVASWTGDEIEFFRGMNLPAAAVASGFRMPSLGAGTPGAPSAGPASASFPAFGAGSGETARRWVRPVLNLIIAGTVGLFLLRGCVLPQRDSAVPRTRASEAPLKVGSTGTLEGRKLRVAGHALVEVAQVHRFYHRHEYVLEDDARNTLLLVCGLAPGAGNWFLCTPVPPEGAPGPVEAGALKVGDRIRLGGASAAITELFRCSIFEADVKPPTLPFGSVSYGFVAESGHQVFLGRWDSTAIRFHRGIAVPATAAQAAFSGKRAP